MSLPTTQRSKHASNAVYALFCGLIVLVFLQQYTGVDVAVANFYFDPTSQTFPWKNTWFANDFMHVYIKHVIEILGGVIISICLLDLIYPIKKISQCLKLRLRFVAISATLIPTIIALLKAHASSHCPWDTEQFGGHYPHLKLFESLPATLKAGHCLPAGHASTGLWLAAFCIFWLPHAPRKAFFVFLLGLSVGFVLGWVQQMRGAHFLSHTLWSMWIASAVIYGQWLVFKKYLEKQTKLESGQCINHY